MQNPRNNELIDYSLVRYDSLTNTFVDDHKFTSIECILKIYLNKNHLITSFCSPGDLEDLIIGMLAQMGKIRNFDDIISLEIEEIEDNFIANVTTTEAAIKWSQSLSNEPRYFSAHKILTCDSTIFPKLSENIKFHAKNILDCADKLLSELAATHGKTNGVHSGVIFDGQKILAFREDIGRHNVFDKLYGWALKNEIDITDKIIVFSGRCSSEMMMKLGRMGISSVAAKSVPTTLSINLAKKLGITLIARMAPGSFCIYTNPERIII